MQKKAGGAISQPRDPDPEWRREDVLGMDTPNSGSSLRKVLQSPGGSSQHQSLAPWQISHYWEQLPGEGEKSQQGTSRTSAQALGQLCSLWLESHEALPQVPNLILASFNSLKYSF